MEIILDPLDLIYFWLRGLGSVLGQIPYFLYNSLVMIGVALRIRPGHLCPVPFNKRSKLHC